MLNSPAWPDSPGGARRHPHPDSELDGKAAERLYDFLRPLHNEVLSTDDISTRLTHTNSSPTNPGWFTVLILDDVGYIQQSPEEAEIL
ncbi:MAG: hypothetical protein ACM32G_00490, partial [Betaproteobacteria bacterium]